MTVFDVPSGLGGTFTVEPRDWQNFETAKTNDFIRAKIWHGRATRTGFDHWDGFNLANWSWCKSDFKNKRTKVIQL